MPNKAGFVRGRHFTTFVDEVKELRRRGQDDDAIALLFKLVDATEAQDRVEGCGVAPWYYEQLAIAFRKQGKSEREIEILERFAAQPHALGASPPKLMARLAKAKERAGL